MKCVSPLMYSSHSKDPSCISITASLANLPGVISSHCFQNSIKKQLPYTKHCTDKPNASCIFVFP